jgi:hypothetical protein
MAYTIPYLRYPGGVIPSTLNGWQAYINSVLGHSAATLFNPDPTATPGGIQPSITLNNPDLYDKIKEIMGYPNTPTTSHVFAYLKLCMVSTRSVTS